MSFWDFLKRKPKRKDIAVQNLKSGDDVPPFSDIALNYNYSMLQQIEEMLRSDESPYNAFDLYASFVVNMIGEYTNTDESIQEFIRDVFKHADDIWQLLKDVLIDMMAKGFGASEIVYLPFGNSVMLRKLMKMHPEHTSYKLEDKEPVAVKYLTGTREVEMPLYKVLILKNGNGIYGFPRAKYMLGWYRLRCNALDNIAINQDEYAQPPIKAFSMNPADTLTAVQKTAKMKRKVFSLGREDSLDFIQVQNACEGLLSNMDKYDTAIHAVLNIPPLLYKQDNKIGSYALTKKQLEVFLQSVKDTAETVANQLIDQLITYLLDLNFENVEDYGKFEILDAIDPENLKLKTETLMMAIDRHVVLNDEEWIRPYLNYPEYDGTLPEVRAEKKKDKEKDGE